MVRPYMERENANDSIAISCSAFSVVFGSMCVCSIVVDVDPGPNSDLRIGRASQLGQ